MLNCWIWEFQQWSERHLVLKLSSNQNSITNYNVDTKRGGRDVWSIPWSYLFHFHAVFRFQNWPNKSMRPLPLALAPLRILGNPRWGPMQYFSKLILTLWTNQIWSLRQLLDVQNITRYRNKLPLNLLNTLCSENVSNRWCMNGVNF